MEDGHKYADELADVCRQINLVTVEIESVGKQEASSNDEEKNFLRRKEEQLRRKEEQLREEKLILLRRSDTSPRGSIITAENCSL